MPIFHASVKTFSRSSAGSRSLRGHASGGGQSAVAAAAYRAGVLLVDARTGQTADYTPRSGVVSAFLILPMTAPPWMADRAMLWNMAEWSEKRCNATVARELEVALPVELPDVLREQLVRQMGNFIASRYNVAVDAAIHLPSKEGDERNHHAHLLFTTREVTRDGFGKKTRILDDRKTGPAEVLVIREQWAAFVNAALAAAGCKDRVDHRSHKDRGIDMPPQIHVGVNATNAVRRGEELASFPVLNKQNKIINYPKIDHGVSRAERNAEIIELQKYRRKETTEEQMARLNAQIIDVNASIEGLRAQLNNSLLSEDLRAKIRIAIEKAIARIFYKNQKESGYLDRVKEARQQARKLHELEEYYLRLILIQQEVQKKYEQEKQEKENRQKLMSAIERMSMALNGVPPYVIKLEIPLSSAFNEASYRSSLRRQTNAELLHAVLSPPTVAPKPALATVALRQDVLQVKELLSRGRHRPAGKGRVSAARSFTIKGKRRG